MLTPQGSTAHLSFKKNKNKNHYVYYSWCWWYNNPSKKIILVKKDHMQLFHFLNLISNEKIYVCEGGGGNGIGDVLRGLGLSAWNVTATKQNLNGSLMRNWSQHKHISGGDSTTGSYFAHKGHVVKSAGIRWKALIAQAAIPVLHPRWILKLDTISSSTCNNFLQIHPILTDSVEATIEGVVCTSSNSHWNTKHSVDLPTRWIAGFFKSVC